MTYEHKIAAFLFFALNMFVLGSGRLALSLRHADLVSPVADKPLIYDWQSLDQRLRTLQVTPTPVRVVRVAGARSTSLPVEHEIEGYIERVFGKHAPTAKKIAFCESSLNPRAKNSHSSAGGLFQFIDRTWIWVRKQMGRSTDLALKFDYQEATDTAYQLFELYGFNATASWRESYHCWK